MKEEEGRTEERPTPTRTPNPLTSHHRNAPTRPAAPVPEAKYLNRNRVVRLDEFSRGDKGRGGHYEPNAVTGNGCRVVRR